MVKLQFTLSLLWLFRLSQLQYIQGNIDRTPNTCFPIPNKKRNLVWFIDALFPLVSWWIKVFVYPIITIGKWWSMVQKDMIGTILTIIITILWTIISPLLTISNHHQPQIFPTQPGRDGAAGGTSAGRGRRARQPWQCPSRGGAKGQGAGSEGREGREAQGWDKKTTKKSDQHMENISILFHIKAY